MITCFHVFVWHWFFCICCIQYKTWKEICTSGKILFTGSEVTFDFYRHFRCYRSFILNKTTFTKYCLTQQVSKLTRSFEIHWVRQYLVNFMGLTGRVNATVYKIKPIFTCQIVLFFNTVTCMCPAELLSLQMNVDISCINHPNEDPITHLCLTFKVICSCDINKWIGLTKSAASVRL